MSLVAAWSSVAEPPPVMTPTEWADKYRYLPAKSRARGAKWKTDAVPYMRGVMDSVTEPGVREVIVQKGVQIAGSEAIHNIAGYFSVQDPWPQMFVHPTEGVAQEWSKERLDDMLNSTAPLKEALNASKSTLNYKEFLESFMVIGGANTPNTFARWSVRVAYGDDIDRWPPVLTDEGDPIDLLRNRTTTFDDPLIVLVSTPTLAGGHIDSRYRSSDQRRYFVRCPKCGREDFITWSDAKHFRVGFDGKDASTARLECAAEQYGGCGAKLSESTRRTMISGGRWIPTAVPTVPGTVGFHIPSMLSMFSSVSLSSIVNLWLKAVAQGKESVRAFINTQLAEGWEDRGGGARPDTFMARRQSYGTTDAGEIIEVPDGVAVLTCGVDVQEDRFVVQVQGWGLHQERWVIDWFTVDGSPKRPESWENLLQSLLTQYTHASGVKLGIAVTTIDSGYETDKVYDFVLANEHSRAIYATKGRGGVQRQITDPIVGSPTEPRRGSGRSVRLFPVNADGAKDNIYSTLAIQLPPAVDGPVPGAWHFPIHDRVDEEYFAQLCSEHKEAVRNKKGVMTHEVYKRDRERNEALDTAVGCLVALMIGMDRNRIKRDLRWHLEVIRTAASKKRSAGPSVPVPHQAPSQAPVRRHSTSGYLKR